MGGELQRYTRDQYQEASVPATVDEAMRLGQIMGASGMFEGVKPEQAVAKVIAGRELGIGPMAAMRGIHLIKGSVRLSAELVATLIKRSGRYDFRAEVGDDHATVTVFDRGEALAPVTFTLEDAKRAGLVAGDGNWRRYPGDMCFTKAVIRAARRHCPEVIGGAVYMDDGDHDTPRGDTPPVRATAGEPQPVEVEAADVPREVSDELLISEAQRRRLFALASEVGASREWVKSVVEDVTGQDSTTRITVGQYDEVCTHIQQGPAADHTQAGGGELPGMPPPTAADPDGGG